MSKRLTNFVKEEFYHIYNRGNSKQIIFHDKEDCERFQDLLSISNTVERIDMRVINKSKNITNLSTSKVSPLVAIGSYCIMPNHFHILITQLNEESGVSKFMQKLTTAYSMYYNKKYTHSGGLFESKFKAKHISDDRYLKYLFAYINLNPVKLIDPTWKERGLKNINKTYKFLETYKYSSYLDFLHFRKENNFREESKILSLKEFPKYFPNSSTFKKEIITWFEYTKF